MIKGKELFGFCGSNIYKDENPFKVTEPGLSQRYDDELKSRVAKISDDKLTVARSDFLAALIASQKETQSEIQRTIANAIEHASSHEVMAEEDRRAQTEDRQAVVVELGQDLSRSAEDKSALLDRVYKSFTRGEIKNMLDGKLPDHKQSSPGLKVDTKTISKTLHRLAGSKPSLNAPHHSRTSLNNLSPQLQINQPTLGR